MTDAPPFRLFANHLLGMTRDVLVRNSSKHGGTPLGVYLHMQRGDVRESQPVLMPDTPAARAQLIETAVVPLVASVRAELVGWTFEGETADPDDADQRRIPVAVVIVIDRERAETHYAPLARALGQTLIGEWLPWGAHDMQTGPLITPIQEALR